MTQTAPPTGKRFSLTGNALKLIAIIAMTVDHIAWMGIEAYAQAETPQQILLHLIGRLTAPIMIFFVAEGYHYTRNYRKYLGRMALLALISHFAFCFFNMSGFDPFQNLMFNATSIAWPLMWGLILLKVWDTPSLSVPLRVLVTLFACAVTVTSDWSCAAPLAILMIGRNRGRFRVQMLWLMGITLLYAAAFYIFHSHVYGILHLGCWLAVPLLAMYNGKRGRAKWLGRFFYWYYPAHMALIGLFLRLFPG